MKLSETHQTILAYLNIGWKLTCHFTDKDGYFDAAIEGGPRQNVRISTIRAMLTRKLIEERFKRPMGHGLFVVEFKECKPA